MFNIQSVRKQLFAETSLWASRVQAAGGGFLPNSIGIANNFVRQLKSKSYASNVVYLLPMLGTNLGAARTPLIDTLNVGSSISTAFVDADFSQSTGLQGNGTTKHLDSQLKPSQVGSSNNGGLGYWELGFATGGTGPIGCSNTLADNSFEIGLRDTFRTFRWGSTANGAQQATVPVNGHYYGNRASATSRILYLSGSSIASDATNDATAGASDRNIYVVGANWTGDPSSDNSLCGMAYITDGGIDATAAADLHILIRDYLMGPSGKPQS